MMPYSFSGTVLQAERCGDAYMIDMRSSTVVEPTEIFRQHAIPAGAFIEDWEPLAEALKRLPILNCFMNLRTGFDRRAIDAYMGGPYPASGPVQVSHINSILAVAEMRGDA